MVPIQKVHHMGKNRRGRIVEQARRGLGGIAGEVPDDQPHAKTVVIAGIGADFSEAGEAGIFTAAVHAHLPQPQQRRRLGEHGQNRGDLPVVDRQQRADKAAAGQTVL